MGIRALACALLRSSMPVAVDAPLEASARLRTEAAAAAAAAAAPLRRAPPSSIGASDVAEAVLVRKASRAVASPRKFPTLRPRVEPVVLKPASKPACSVACLPAVMPSR